MIFPAYLGFGRPWLLSLLAFAIIPVWIHLAKRRSPPTQVWGAMQLLRSVEGNRRRRSKWEDIGLLLSRIAMLAAVAFCAADLYWRPHGGAHPDRLLLILDNSLSMRRKTSSGSAWERALAYTRQAVATGDYDRIALVLSSPVSDNIGDRATGSVTTANEWINSSETLALLDRISPSTQADDWNGCAIKARELLSKDMGNDTVGVVLLHDRMRNEASHGNIVDSLTGVDSVSLIDVGDSSPANNVYITRLELKNLAPTTRDDLQFEAWIACTTKAPTSGELRWMMDGQPVAFQLVQLSAGQSTRIAWNHPGGEAGIHEIAAQWMGQDELAADNTRKLNVNIREAIRVLCLGDHGMQGDRESRLAIAAMTPRSTSPIQAKSASTSFWNSDELSNYDVVCAFDLRSLNANEWANLHSFANDGNGVWWVLGPNADANAYPPSKPPLERDALFPARLADAYDVVAPLNLLAPDHPLFSSAEWRGELSALVTRVRRLEPFENDARVLAAWGDVPALVENRIGLGRVLIWPSPFSFPANRDNPANGNTLSVRNASDTTWSYWPYTPAFVPWTQAIVRYLAHDASCVTIPPNQPDVRESQLIRRPADESLAGFNADSAWRTPLDPPNVAALSNVNTANYTRLADENIGLTNRSTIGRRKHDRSLAGICAASFALALCVERWILRVKQGGRA